MILGADNQIENIIDVELSAAIRRWRYSAPSVILHHGKRCCSVAREWLFSMDHSQLNGHHRLMGPRWLRKKYEWGPSQWPMAWCQAVEQDALDCGALAALSREIYTSRGVGCHAVELIQQYTAETTDHWSIKWNDHPASTHWIQGALIYHEACAVQGATQEIKVWDPSAGWWANPKQFRGYGSIAALRVTADHDLLQPLVWGEHAIQCGKWQIIENSGGSKRDTSSDRGDLVLSHLDLSENWSTRPREIESCKER
jgi:hypothetical protein